MKSHDFLWKHTVPNKQNLQDLLRTPRFPIFIELTFLILKFKFLFHIVVRFL